MKVIHLGYPHSFHKEDFPSLAMAIGFFDGIHKGHKRVIETAMNIATENNLKSAVMTFNPHPSVVLGKKSDVKYITPLDEKIKLMESLHIDYLFIVHFSKEFSQLDAEQFVQSYLVDIHVDHVVAGFDFTYGKFGRGNMETLKNSANGKFQVTTVEKLENQQQKISSTAIRKLLNEGEVSYIPQLLGRFYSVRGTVIHGDKRGRQIGFPTANTLINSEYILPETGVYAVRIFVKNAWRRGVCNIGYRPTFKSPGENALSVEVYIIDFDEIIYGEDVEIEWHKRIRAEKKFNGIEELIDQLNKDTEMAKQYFQEIDK